MEKELITQTLDEVNGNKTKAADRLGISIRTLRNKLASYKNPVENWTKLHSSLFVKEMT